MQLWGVQLAHAHAQAMNTLHAHIVCCFMSLQAAPPGASKKNEDDSFDLEAAALTGGCANRAGRSRQFVSAWQVWLPPPGQWHGAGICSSNSAPVPDARHTLDCHVPGGGTVFKPLAGVVRSLPAPIRWACTWLFVAAHAPCLQGMR